MKFRISVIVALSLLFTAQVFAQIDRSKQPTPGPAPKASFPAFAEAKLDNGLKVFVIENHSQPVITFRLLIKSGSEFDGAHSGIASFVTDLLTSGTASRDKLAFAREEDLLGLSIGASAGDDMMSLSGSGLKKHMPKLLELMTDALLHPTFPQAELDKVKKQALSGLESTKKDPDAVMSRLSITSCFEGHPYARFQTERDVEATTQEELVRFHQTYFVPNNASIAIVGDVTMKEILPVLKKYFGTWKKGEVPTASFPTPPAMKGTSVRLVDLGATQTQSAIAVLTTAVPRNDPDFIALQLMNSIIGGGFSGRLFQNLREQHAFTYGAYSNFDARKMAGSWSASANVRRAATDSAFTEILREMAIMRNETVTDSTLTMHKQYLSGQFLLSLESPATVAQRVQFIDLYNLPKDYYRTYVSSLMRVTAADLQRLARKYLDAKNATFAVVGDASAISAKLQTFGSVQQVDTDMQPVKPSQDLPVDIDAEALITKHIAATGGADKLAAIRDRTTEGDVELAFGPQKLDGSMQQIDKAPNKTWQKMVFMMQGQTFETEQWCNGTTVVSIEPMQEAKTLEGDELAKALEDAQFNELLRWKELGYSATVTAKRKMGDATLYILEMKKQHGVDVFLINAGTYLLQAKQTTQTSPQGEQMLQTTFADYRPVDGVMLPHSMTLDAGQMRMAITVTSYKQNTGVDDGVFLKK
jgi:zinc protease